MASTPFPIELHDHTRAGIRWRVSIQPEPRVSGEVLVRFLKRGKHSKLLDQHCRWCAQGSWVAGHGPSVRVPQDLRHRSEAELQQRRAHSPALGNSVPQFRRLPGCITLRSPPWPPLL